MIVVDASVVFKWVIDEHDAATTASRALRNQFLVAKEEILAPDLLLYEIANILAHKTTLSKTHKQRAWGSFISLNVPIVAATGAYAADCLTFSLKYHVSVYDAAYLVLAKTKGATFVTADEKLAAKVKLPYIQSVLRWLP